MTLFEIMAQEASVSGDALTSINQWWQQASPVARAELMARVNVRTYPAYHPVLAVGGYLEMFLPPNQE